MEIKDLTSCLLKNLQPCRSHVSFTAGAAMLASNLSRLPSEVMSAIFDELVA